MIKQIKIYLHKRKIEKKIKYIYNFVHGICPHKMLDSELDNMEEEIIEYMKNSKKYSYAVYSDILIGIRYHKNANRELINILTKEMESNVEETQNAVCEAIERSNEDVR